MRKWFTQLLRLNKENVSITNLTLQLPKKLRKAIEKNATTQRISKEAFIIKILEREVISSEYIRPDIVDKGLPKLKTFLEQIPSIKVISFDKTCDYKWWIKFDIEMEHQLAWHVIQALGFVLNYISLSERLPTVFMPVSPPPYLNGGPEEFLSWVIESQIPYLDPEYIVSVLKERLPNPVDDINQWIEDDS